MSPVSRCFTLLIRILILWYMSNDGRLGKNAKKAFDSAELGNSVVIVPTIVLAEAFHVLRKKNEAGRFHIIVKKLSVGENFTSFPLDIRTVGELPKSPKIKELHDKILVASTALLNAVLLTKDDNIQESGCVKTARLRKNSVVT